MKMETFIVYVDDKQHALQQIVPMLHRTESQDPASRWILVGCPPKFSRHSGRWLSQHALKQWRQDWTDKNTAALVHVLKEFGNAVSVKTVHGPLADYTQQLRNELGFARVVDARRPKLSVNLAPVTKEQPQEKSNWALPGGFLAMGAFIVMASE
jgi:hypothetical protein